MIDDNVKPLETELTRLSTVSPPQTPAYSSAPVHTKPATLYRTIEEEDPGNNINGEPTGDHDQLVHAHHR